jgi:hypothetical protein
MKHPGHVVYIINLKMDVVLYARAVNSIRKYFYDEHKADHVNKILMRQLPQSAHFPPYWDVAFALVVCAFAIFNSLYVSLGTHLSLLSWFKPPSSIREIGLSGYGLTETAILLSVTSIVFFGHFVTYYLFVRDRQYSYLRSSAIGVDIDGVLNRHREKFSEMLTKLGKAIHPDEIKLLPVHENINLSQPVTREDERRIFNDPQYWTQMPEMDGAAEAIRSIKRSYLLPVHIFTHRPWPDVLPTDAGNEESATAVRKRWRSAVLDMLEQTNAKECTKLWVRLVTKLNYKKSMEYITRCWLYRARIEFNSLLVERGNENIAYAKGRYENRFNYAKRKKIRFFVEDDWVKALKLSYICDVVFLISHPYNQSAREDSSKHAHGFVIGKLPANVIRVESWGEIKRILGQLV